MNRKNFTIKSSKKTLYENFKPIYLNAINNLYGLCRCIIEYINSINDELPV